MNEAEEKSIVYEVAGWLWGTVQGGFNEQQTISQILVDAVVGMIPLVGDVTAVRDLIAVLLRMSDDPKKREDVGEWMTLVLLLFAMIPVAGGAIKGCGKLLLKAGSEAGQHVNLLRDMVHLLNRIGEGNGVKFLAELDLEKYLPALRGNWILLTQRIDGVLEAVVRRMGSVMTDGMIQRLEVWRREIKVLAGEGDQMIPEAVKELNRRLKLAQSQVYEGEWHEIPSTLKSKTREAEARLVKDNAGVEIWEATNIHHPPSTERNIEAARGWPDLHQPQYLNKYDGTYSSVTAFHGPIQPIKVPAGTKLYRVLGDHGNSAGAWWLTELPKDGKLWRKKLAVLDVWNPGKFYVEFTAPTELFVWAGAASSQMQKNVKKAAFGQYLSGGHRQLFIDFSFPAHAEAAAAAQSLPWHLTNWTSHTNLGVPRYGEKVRRLGHHEIIPKMTHRVARGAATAQRAARIKLRDDENDK